MSKKYWDKVREIKEENLVFVDESGSNLAMVRLYGRAKRGERVRGEKPQKRGGHAKVLINILLLQKRDIIGIVDPNYQNYSKCDRLNQKYRFKKQNF